MLGRKGSQSFARSHRAAVLPCVSHPSNERKKRYWDRNHTSRKVKAKMIGCHFCHVRQSSSKLDSCHQNAEPTCSASEPHCGCERVLHNNRQAIASCPSHFSKAEYCFKAPVLCTHRAGIPQEPAVPPPLFVKVLDKASPGTQGTTFQGF